MTNYYTFINASTLLTSGRFTSLELAWKAAASKAFAEGTQSVTLINKETWFEVRDGKDRLLYTARPILRSEKPSQSNVKDNIVRLSGRPGFDGWVSTKTPTPVTVDILQRLKTAPLAPVVKRNDWENKVYVVSYITATGEYVSTALIGNMHKKAVEILRKSSTGSAPDLLTLAKEEAVKLPPPPNAALMYIVDNTPVVLCARYVKERS